MFLFLVAFSIAIAWSVAQSKRTGEEWAKTAKRLRLRYTPGGVFSTPTINGTLNGCHVTASIVRKGGGKNRRRYTVCRAEYPKALGIGLRLTREGFLSGVAKMFGAEDIEVGDARFDDDVRVQARSERRLLEFLTPARRLRIHRFLMSHRRAVIGDAHLTDEKFGVIRGSQTLSRHIEMIADLAWFLTGDREEDVPVARAIEARSRGDLERALAELQRNEEVRAEAETQRTSQQSQPPPVKVTLEPAEEKAMRGEILQLIGREDEAAKAFEEAVEIAPDDEELQVWLAELDASRQAPPTDVTGAVAVEDSSNQPAVAEHAAIDVATMCGDLFAAGYSSFESGKRFDSQYKGKTIQWAGVLRSLDSFSYDYVLGNEAGTKAVLEVHKVETGFIGSGEVSAIVRLPPESREDLRNRIGERLEFTGELLKLDGLMKNVYVASGQVSGTD